MMLPSPIYSTGNEQRYMAEAIASGHLCGDGPFTHRCERWLESALHAQRVLLTTSGTAALEMAALLCDLQPGDEVIMPSFTFTSTATAFVRVGATPVFVDVDPITCNISPECVAAAITPKTRAIVPVHYAGNACHMEEIVCLARKHHLWVIEDAAQAILSRHKNKHLGTIGHLGCLSFHESKNIQCGEGGALIINDSGLLERAEILREKGTNRTAFFRGQVSKYMWLDIGSSYVLGELNAAFLWAQLEKAESILKKRTSNFKTYHEQLLPLSQHGHFCIPQYEEPYDGNGHIFYIITQDNNARSSLMNYLSSKNIPSFFHYVPLHTSPAGKKYCRCSGNLPHTEKLGESLLRLPISSNMTLQQVQTITAEIRKYYLT